MPLPPAWRSGAWFLAVGGTAAAIHTLVFQLTHPPLWPELANAAGFGVAFWVSFAGHRWRSFAGTAVPLLQSLRRFAAVSLAGFAVNEALFVLLLRGLGLPPLAALVVALGLTAVQTFLLGRWWAFRR